MAHRDIKSENILLDRYFNVKLTDFGFCREAGRDKSGKTILSKTYCGSAAYVAPEVLQSTPYDPKQSDVWSLGVVLFVMVNNALPFDDSDLAKMVQRQLAKQWHFSTKVVDKLSPELKDLIRSMLEPDPQKRPDLQRILKHPWLRDTPHYLSIGSKDMANMAPKTGAPIAMAPKVINVNVNAKADPPTAGAKVIAMNTLAKTDPTNTAAKVITPTMPAKVVPKFMGPKAKEVKKRK